MCEIVYTIIKTFHLKRYHFYCYDLHGSCLKSLYYKEKYNYQLGLYSMLWEIPNHHILETLTSTKPHLFYGKAGVQDLQVTTIFGRSRDPNRKKSLRLKWKRVLVIQNSANI